MSAQNSTGIYSIGLVKRGVYSPSSLLVVKTRGLFVSDPTPLAVPVLWAGP